MKQKLLILVVSLSLLPGSATLAGEQLPNVVFTLSDDLGDCDVGFCDAAAVAQSFDSKPLITVLEDAVDGGSVIGAQLAIGSTDGVVSSRQFGVIAPGAEQAVDSETLFCIGSCSKPFASALMMTLVDEGVLSLDDRIDKWLPAFANLETEEGQVADRAPTVRELLSHRSGIYTQRRKLTPTQTRAIRDFRLSLDDSVSLIAKQPLIALPGESFAYSGAGYCVLGRVAEHAARQDIERLLQAKICQPLGLIRTTYFPGKGLTNVAVGGRIEDGRVVPHPDTPHMLRDELRLPLIGGSIYSTAEETSQFARMMLNEGQGEDGRIFTQDAWDELTRRQFDNQGYGLGWTQTIKNRQTAALRHNGALYSSRSLLYVNLAESYTVVVHWTLSDPAAEDIRQQLNQAL